MATKQSSGFLGLGMGVCWSIMCSDSPDLIASIFPVLLETGNVSSNNGWVRMD
jgi:hypothetical protein